MKVTEIHMQAKDDGEARIALCGFKNPCSRHFAGWEGVTCRRCLDCLPKGVLTKKLLCVRARSGLTLGKVYEMDMFYKMNRDPEGPYYYIKNDNEVLTEAFRNRFSEDLSIDAKNPKKVEMIVDGVPGFTKGKIYELYPAPENHRDPELYYWVIMDGESEPSGMFRNRFRIVA